MRATPALLTAMSSVSPSAQYAIYLAYKVGPNPRFKRMMMLSSAMEDERYLTSYINAFTAVFRAAPAPIAKAVGGPSGIFLMVDGNPVRDPKDSTAVKSRKPSSRESPKMRSMGDADLSKYSSPGGGSEGKQVKLLVVRLGLPVLVYFDVGVTAHHWCTAPGSKSRAFG
jgi:hypothetical protein